MSPRLKSNRHIAMLVPHPPHQDPRVEWVTRSLKKDYTVKVFYTYSGELTNIDLQQYFYKNHEAVFIPFKYYIGRPRYFWTFLKAIMPTPLAALLLPIAAIFLGTMGVIWGTTKVLGTLLKLLLRTLRKVFYYNSSTRSIFLKNFRSAWLKIKTISRFFLKKKYYGQTSIGFFQNQIRYFYGTFASLQFGLNNMSDKFDAIYCHELSSLLVGISYKKKTGCKLIYDSHEIYWDSINHSPFIFRIFFKYYELLLLKHVDTFISVSPQIANFYIGTSPKLRSKSLVVPNASPIIFPQNSSTKYASTGKVGFLYQGSFTPGRGLEDLIHAWVMANPQNAVLVMRGPESSGMKVKLSKIAGSHVNHTIFFAPSVPEDELISSAIGFDVGLIPYPPSSSLNQKFCSPNKLSQYMQSGLAILAANTEFVEETIKSNDCGIIYKGGDIRNLAAQIEILATFPELLKRLKTNSKKTGLEVFNWEFYEKHLLANLQSTI